jgi:thioesterase domain-containing protein
VASFLADLLGHDIRVWAAGERLRCNAPVGALTPELRDQLQKHKSEILEFLRAAEAFARQHRGIVPLQPHGTRTPVFAVGGHTGDVFCYRDLVQHLGDDQPFFGLQPPGVDGHGEPIARVEDLAAYFAAQIRAFRPVGPCIIAGFCAGGTVAFELARQLVQDGADISFLVLFASPYPTSCRRLPQLRQILAYQLRRVGKHARALALRSWGKRRRYITEKLRLRKARRDANQAAARAAARDPVLLLLAKVGRATTAAIRRYEPRPFAGRVKMILPTKAWLDSVCGPRYWRSVAQHTQVYFGPDGCNVFDMLREPYARAMAELFRRCREKSDMQVASTPRAGAVSIAAPALASTSSRSSR